MRTLIFFSAFLFLLVSCTSNQPNENSSKQILTTPDKAAEQSYFKDHFEIADVIQIETGDDLLIADIKKVIRYKDRIILLSGGNSTVFVIDAKNGDIQTRINRTGTGPGESKLILDIAFDESSEQILIYNDYAKLLFFDLQGAFLSEINIDGTYENISWYNGEVFFHNKMDGYSSSPYLVRVLNTENNTWREIGHEGKVDFPIRSMGRHLVRSKKLWFTAPLDFNLFYLAKNQIQSPYEIFIPNSQIDNDLITGAVANPQKFFDEVVANHLIYAVNSVRETTYYLIFRSNQEGVFIINKKDNEVYWDSHVDENTLGVKLTYYFPHDGDDDMVMFVLPADVYTQRAQSDTEQSVSSLNVREDDNPILIFYKQKST